MVARVLRVNLGGIHGVTHPGAGRHQLVIVRSDQRGRRPATLRFGFHRRFGFARGVGIGAEEGVGPLLGADGRKRGKLRRLDLLLLNLRLLNLRLRLLLLLLLGIGILLLLCIG